MRASARPSRRRSSRLSIQIPLEVTVFGFGIPATVPGRTINISKSGICVVLPLEVDAGEIVALRLGVPQESQAVRIRARIRYANRLRYGMEFVGLTPASQSAVAKWMRTMDTAKVSGSEEEATLGKELGSGLRREELRGLPENIPPVLRKRGSGAAWLVAIFALFVILLAWTRWNDDWKRLEAGLTGLPNSVSARPELQVPGEVMQKLVVHRVEPEYPDEARSAGLQAVIVLNVIVGRDGSVLQVAPLNGPELLAQSAADAMRWWKFQPYRVHGKSAIVETTVAMEFKP